MASQIVTLPSFEPAAGDARRGQEPSTLDIGFVREKVGHTNAEAKHGIIQP
jgi:hypothetical protein